MNLSQSQKLWGSSPPLYFFPPPLLPSAKLQGGYGQSQDRRPWLDQKWCQHSVNLQSMQYRVRVYSTSILLPVCFLKGPIDSFTFLSNVTMRFVIVLNKRTWWWWWWYYSCVKNFVAPLLGAPRSSGAPVHWTAWTPGFYATLYFSPIAVQIRHWRQIMRLVRLMGNKTTGGRVWSIWFKSKSFSILVNWWLERGTTSQVNILTSAITYLM